MSTPLWRQTGHDSKEALIREVKQLVDNLSLCLEDMEANERRFVEDTANRVEQYGDETTITVKQLGWLRDLNTKY